MKSIVNAHHVVVGHTTTREPHEGLIDFGVKSLIAAARQSAVMGPRSMDYDGLSLPGAQQQGERHSHSSTSMNPYISGEYTPTSWDVVLPGKGTTMYEFVVCILAATCQSLDCRGGAAVDPLPEAKELLKIGKNRGKSMRRGAVTCAYCKNPSGVYLEDFGPYSVGVHLVSRAKTIRNVVSWKRFFGEYFPRLTKNATAVMDVFETSLEVIQGLACGRTVLPMNVSAYESMPAASADTGGMGAMERYVNTILTRLVCPEHAGATAAVHAWLATLGRKSADLDQMRVQLSNSKLRAFTQKLQSIEVTAARPSDVAAVTKDGSIGALWGTQSPWVANRQPGEQLATICIDSSMLWGTKHNAPLLLSVRGNGHLLASRLEESKAIPYRIVGQNGVSIDSGVGFLHNRGVNVQTARLRAQFIRFLHKLPVVTVEYYFMSKYDKFMITGVPWAAVGDPVMRQIARSPELYELPVGPTRVAYVSDIEREYKGLAPYTPGALIAPRTQTRGNIRQDERLNHVTGGDFDGDMHSGFLALSGSHTVNGATHMATFDGSLITLRSDAISNAARGCPVTGGASDDVDQFNDTLKKEAQSAGDSIYNSLILGYNEIDLMFSTPPEDAQLAAAEELGYNSVPLLAGLGKIAALAGVHIHTRSYYVGKGVVDIAECVDPAYCHLTSYTSFHSEITSVIKDVGSEEPVDFPKTKAFIRSLLARDMARCVPSIGFDMDADWDEVQYLKRMLIDRCEGGCHQVDREGRMKVTLMHAGLQICKTASMCGLMPVLQYGDERDESDFSVSLEGWLENLDSFVDNRDTREYTRFEFPGAGRLLAIVRLNKGVLQTVQQTIAFEKKHNIYFPIFPMPPPSDFKEKLILRFECMQNHKNALEAQTIFRDLGSLFCTDDTSVPRPGLASMHGVVKGYEGMIADKLMHHVQDALLRSLAVEASAKAPREEKAATVSTVIASRKILGIRTLSPGSVLDAADIKTIQVGAHRKRLFEAILSRPTRELLGIGTAAPVKSNPVEKEDDHSALSAEGGLKWVYRGQKGYAAAARANIHPPSGVGGAIHMIQNVGQAEQGKRVKSRPIDETDCAMYVISYNDGGGRMLIGAHESSSAAIHRDAASTYPVLAVPILTWGVAQQQKLKGVGVGMRKKGTPTCTCRANQVDALRNGTAMPGRETVYNILNIQITRAPGGGEQLDGSIAVLSTQRPGQMVTALILPKFARDAFNGYSLIAGWHVKYPDIDMVQLLRDFMKPEGARASYSNQGLISWDQGHDDICEFRLRRKTLNGEWSHPWGCSVSKWAVEQRVADLLDLNGMLNNLTRAHGRTTCDRHTREVNFFPIEFKLDDASWTNLREHLGPQAGRSGADCVSMQLPPFHFPVLGARPQRVVPNFCMHDLNMYVKFDEGENGGGNCVDDVTEETIRASRARVVNNDSIALEVLKAAQSLRLDIMVSQARAIHYGMWQSEEDEFLLWFRDGLTKAVKKINRTTGTQPVDKLALTMHRLIQDAIDSLKAVSAKIEAPGVSQLDLLGPKFHVNPKQALWLVGVKLPENEKVDCGKRTLLFADPSKIPATKAQYKPHELDVHTITLLPNFEKRYFDSGPASCVAFVYIIAPGSDIGEVFKRHEAYFRHALGVDNSAVGTHTSAPKKVAVVVRTSEKHSTVDPHTAFMVGKDIEHASQFVNDKIALLLWVQQSMYLRVAVVPTTQLSNTRKKSKNGFGVRQLNWRKAVQSVLTLLPPVREWASGYIPELQALHGNITTANRTLRYAKLRQGRNPELTANEINRSTAKNGVVYTIMDPGSVIKKHGTMFYLWWMYDRLRQWGKQSHHVTRGNCVLELLLRISEDLPVARLLNQMITKPNAEQLSVAVNGVARVGGVTVRSEHAATSNMILGEEAMGMGPAMLSWQKADTVAARRVRQNDKQKRNDKRSLPGEDGSFQRRRRLF